MKAFLLGTIATLSLSSAVMAAPYSPMTNYTPSDHSENELTRIWSEMRTDLKGKDCYRRAHLWAYSMKQKRNVDSSKIFIHYTNKFNRELDNMGRGKMGWFERKFFSVDGVSKRDIGMFRSNITWDYHVAPMLSIENEDVVVDRYLDLAYDASYPYTDQESWNLYTRPASPSEWVEALTVRGEILWKIRKQELLNDKAEAEEKLAKNKSKLRNTSSKSSIKKYKKKIAKYQTEVNEINSTMSKLEMVGNDSIDITCKQVDSIAEVDKNHDTAWCFYSVAPMYYYNEMDLRYLAYGETGSNYAAPPALSVHTEENYQNGRNYVQNSFNPKELKDAKGEIKEKRTE